jgi:hypothetical protein
MPWGLILEDYYDDDDDDDDNDKYTKRWEVMTNMHTKTCNRQH